MIRSYGAYRNEDHESKITMLGISTTLVAMIIRSILQTHDFVGGQIVAPPFEKSFGSTLIERGLIKQLEGADRLEFAPAGINCFVEARLSTVIGREWLSAWAAEQKMGNQATL